MRTRGIGSLEVSVIGLGCNNFGMRIDEVQSRRVVNAALDAGINHFDTADIYGKTQSEQFLGRALGEKRGQVLIATKFGMEVDPQRRGAGPDYVQRACEDSLRRLGTDYIDLYWLHQPDPAVPLADTLGAMDKLVKAGKVREIGCSNFSASQLREAEQESARLGTARFVALQNEMSMIHQEPRLPEDAGDNRNGTLAECARLNVAFVPYFPLASGLLSGKYRQGHPIPEGSRLATSPRGAQYLTPERLQLVERLRGWVADYNLRHRRSGDFGPESRPYTILDLAHAWLLAQPAVASVISGATSAQQVADNAAAGDWELSEQELAEVDELLQDAQAAGV